MNDFLLHLTTANQQYNIWITWGGFLIFLMIALNFSFPAMSQKWKEWRMVRCINKASQEVMHDVFLPDGLGGVHYFPFIILTRQAIVFFKTMQFRGIIFAADTIDFWTQVVGKRSYKFHNPMPGLEAEIASIRAVDKKVDIEGRVVFTSDSHFTKGRPEAVMLETEIKPFLEDKMQGEISTQLSKAWGLLKAIAEEGHGEKQDKLLMATPGVLSTFRYRMVWFFSCLSIAWLLMRLV